MNISMITADQRAADVLARQHGVISGTQALQTGLSHRQIQHRVDSGRWVRRTRNVFVLAGSPDTWRQRAWIGYLATHDADGVVSHVTAGAVLHVLEPLLLPHVTVPPGRSYRCGVAKVHRRVVPAQDRLRRDGLMVTTPSRLLVDMAGCLARPALEELTDAVLCRRLASVESVTASLHRVGRSRGGGLLREVLQVWSVKIEPGSVAEVRLLRLLAEYGVVDVITQHDVYDANGDFIGRLDVARVGHRKGLEYDSVRWHNPRRWERDESRYARFRAAGWDVEGVTKADLVPGETRLADIAARWIAAAAA